MWTYGLLLLAILILLIISAIYIVKLTYTFITRYIKNKHITRLLSFIPLILFMIGIIIDAANAIAVDVYLILIISLVKLIFLIIKKIFKKEVNEYIIFLLGVLTMIIILLNAYYLDHHVVKTNYDVYTQKDIGTNNFRIVQISDSHIGTTMDGKKFSKYIQEINKLKPDIVVLTGDFVDDSTTYKDMLDAVKGLSNLKTKYGVYFIYGNHDKGYSNSRDFNAQQLFEELTRNNITVLEDTYTNITENIILIGRQDREVSTRFSAQELTKNLDKSKYLIMLDHQPNDYDNEIKSEVDLVLSGHTHGGQLFPLGELGLLLKANDKIYGIETKNKTTFIVSSGISDWALKFKNVHGSEYVVVDIKNNKE